MSDDNTFTQERAELCANLHNEILAFTASKIPNYSATPTKDLADLVLNAIPEWRHLEGYQELPVYRMFSLMDRYSQMPQAYGIPQLTPSLEGTVPGLMKLDPWIIQDESRPLVRLFMGASGREDDSLLFDMITGLASCHTTPHQFPEEEDFRPLEDILRTWLELWQTGKFVWHSTHGRFEAQGWLSSDVDAVFEAWEELLDAIDDKRSNFGAQERLEPLDEQTLDQHPISDYAKALLARLKRPTFKYIAPSISVFSPESFNELYSTEFPAGENDQAINDLWQNDCLTSMRRTFIKFSLSDEPSQIPTLIFPSDKTVPIVTKDQSFNKAWGFARCTVCRRAGLYVGLDTFYSDTVTFVDPAGGTNAFGESRGGDAFGLPQASRVGGMLKTWAQLVRLGTWNVDGNGVSDDASWYNNEDNLLAARNAGLAIE